MRSPGAEIGRFRIEGTLGRGGMAVVYRAYDAELHRPVAIKVLADHLTRDPELRTRFEREARMAARLSHPNIVSVFDIGQDERERPFIVMEHVDGETLAATLAREGPLDAARVAGIGTQCCAGLAYAHAAGLIHRDVKPANLLVAADGTVKLADFGVARALDQAQITQAGSIVGTMRYLAPEQAAGKGVTAAADVYSLGAVLYELLTGATPHDDVRSVAELVVAQRRRPVTPIRAMRADVPAWLDTAVCACLAPAPPDRPAPEALARMLATPAANEPATARLPAAQPVHTRHRRVHPRSRWIAAAVAAAAAIALVLVLALTLGTGGGRPSPPANTPSAPTGGTPALHAANLARWIGRHTG